MSPTVEKMCLEHLEQRGKPLEVSCFWYELDADPMETIGVLHELARRGEVWWMDVGEEHAIVGLPTHEKPTDPTAYIS